MISAFQSSTSTKNTVQLDFVPILPKVAFSARYLVHSSHCSVLAVRDPFTNKSNTVHRSPTATSIDGTLVDNLSSYLSHSRPTFHLGRVATADCHDTNTWTRERTVHDTMPNVVAASSPLSSNDTTLDDYSSVDAAGSSLSVMEFRTHGVRTMEQSPNAAPLREDTVPPYNWTPLVAPGLGVPPIRHNITSAPCSCKDLSEGRRRVGEILVRCGVIAVSRMEPNETATVGCSGTHGVHPVDLPAVSCASVKLGCGESDRPLITALANWTSEWVHTLVIQPYLQGSFCFQYQGKSSRVSTSVALRIRRVLSDVCNPVQVAIHALWFIGMLTAGDDTHDHAISTPPFLSIPIFRFLHNNGAFVAEDFMFRTFITCAMIGDKTVNDTAFSTNTWSRLTRIPQAILNATEKHALSCLKWNVMMTRVQWHDTIVYLRSCIKMGSTFDPFAYDETSPSGIMARRLDELINLSEADETCISQQGAFATEILAPQPIRHFTHWGVFNTAEWCPKDDPVVNQKPRTVGIAPGANQGSGTYKAGTTAKELLDSILGSSNVRDLVPLARPESTSFCGSFGAVGVRLARTVKITGACRSTPWFPSHG